MLPSSYCVEHPARQLWLEVGVHLRVWRVSGFHLFPRLSCRYEHNDLPRPCPKGCFQASGNQNQNSAALLFGGTWGSLSFHSHGRTCTTAAGEYPAILNISRTGHVVLMYRGRQSEETLLRIREQSLSRGASQSAVRR